MMIFNLISMKKTLLPIAALAVMASCSQPQKKEATVEDSVATQPVAEVADEWEYLFDGSSLDGWRAFNGDSLPANWIIEEGSLKSLGSGGDLGGDIVYAAKEFEDFDLMLEWKISEGGNSGIFYHVMEGEQYHAPYYNAPEYQLIDDVGFPQELEEWQQLGADYAMHTADKEKKIIKPVGEWNTARIVFTKEKVEHYLNGEKIVEFVPWSEDWYEKKSTGKWKDFPDYGVSRTGFIGLQDHGSYIWFRNIRIKTL